MVLTEGEVHTQEEWCRLLGLSESSFSELILLGVLAPTRSEWGLQLVGTLILKDRGVVCIPCAARLFGDSPDSEKAVEKLSLVLRMYHYKSSARKVVIDRLGLMPASVSASDRGFREAEALLGLIDHTDAYGFHFESDESVGDAVSGSVDWTRTLSRQIPVRTRTSVAYLHVVVRRRTPRFDSLAMTQAVVLRRLAHKYQAVLPETIRAVWDMIAEAGEIVDSHPEVPILESRSDLYDALDSTNLDHERDLASLLIAAADAASSAPDDRSGVALYGTTRFEGVWEDICRAAFGGGSAESLVLSNPTVHLTGGQTRAIDHQRPDVTFEHAAQFYIVDAKYYPNFPSSMPSLEDIRKQVFYVASALAVGAKTGFVIPGRTDKILERIGDARFEFPKGAPDSRFAKVELVNFDWEAAVESYLRTDVSRTLVPKLAALLR